MLGHRQGEHSLLRRLVSYFFIFRPSPFCHASDADNTSHDRDMKRPEMKRLKGCGFFIALVITIVVVTRLTEHPP
jgi:hypothetical protein